MQGHDIACQAVSTDSVAARIPPGRRIYAVGDIHGRRDLLDDIHARILDDAAKADQSGNLCRVAIYIGDYVDRGPMVKETISTLLENPLPVAGFKTVYLKGNHEDLLTKFLNNHAVGRNWLGNGGEATLRSYGVEIGRDQTDEDNLRRAQSAFRAAMPESHEAFFAGLNLYYSEGDYYFSHAGVSPRRSLADQSEGDLLWIRDEFLSCDRDFGKVIVHGHSIAPEPQIRPNRIGIDTGAYATGRLTCLVLQENVYGFLQTE